MAIVNIGMAIRWSEGAIEILTVSYKERVKVPTKAATIVALLIVS
jgi:hypothetical protein